MFERKQTGLYLPNRREMILDCLKGLAVGGIACAAGGVLAPGTILAWNMPFVDPTPALTEGPYWVDERLNRSDIRVDPSTGAAATGLKTAIGLNVSRLVNGTLSPVRGAYVDLWHANALGVYSDVQAQSTVGRKFLRGYQTTTAHGNVQFVTVFPGWYSGRTPHIHFRVRQFSGNTVTFNFVSQLFFTESVIDDIYSNVAPYNTRRARDTTNSTDSVYNTNYTYNGNTVKAGSETTLRMFENRALATSTFNIIIVD